MICGAYYDPWNVKTVWIIALFVVIAGTSGANVNFSGIFER
jgi:hypothetical protein